MTTVYVPPVPERVFERGLRVFFRVFFAGSWEIP